MTAAAGSRTTAVTLMDFNARFRLDRRVRFRAFFVYFSRDCQKSRAQKIRAIFV
jgi:hypothetical protein